MLAGINIRQRQLEIQPHEQRERDGDRPHGQKVDDRSGARIPAASENTHDDCKVERPKRQREAHHEGRIRSKRLRCRRGVGVKIGDVYPKCADKHRNERANERGEPKETLPVNIGVILPACAERIADDDRGRCADSLKQDEGKLVHRADDHHRSESIRAHFAVNRILRKHAERPDGIIQQHGRAYGDERADVRKHMVEQLVPFCAGGGIPGEAEEQQRAAITAEPMSVATAAPRTPSIGKPRLPKMRQ